MLRLFSLLVICLFCSILYQSCAIEKRHYRKGFHVEWLAKKGATKQEYAKKQRAENFTGISLNAELQNQQTTLSSFNVQASVPSPKQLNEKNKVQHNLKKVSPVPKSKQHPLLTKAKSHQAVISASSEKTEDGKSQIIALVLCFAIGIIGIHRFYLGYYGIGVIQLLTLGMCGIWTLVDLVLIITGDLQPKDGEYEDTL